MKRILLSTLFLAACGGGGGGGAPSFVPPHYGPTPTPQPHTTPTPRPKPGAIEHIVVIIQENRTVDNLFQFLPGADTASKGLDSTGNMMKLQPVSLAANYDMRHRHADFVADYDDGKMDGWNHDKGCAGACPLNAAYAYVPKNEVKPYYDMAEQYAFGDRMFQTNQGPSYPAHQYVVSGASTVEDGSEWSVSDNPGNATLSHHRGGCDSPPKTTVPTIDTLTGDKGKKIYPCFKRRSIMEELDYASISWHYYQAGSGAGLWNAVDSLKGIRNGPEYRTNVTWPSSKIFEDIETGNLATVTFVTPTAKASDHGGVTDGTGPDWVASIVNAIGTSRYWKNTAIVVTWDDFGGMYDHVKPTIYNAYEDGFRVPLLVVSPYAKRGYVSHQTYEFGSILKFIEENFGLGSLGTTDVRSNSLSDCFDLNQTPIRFKPIHTSHTQLYFEKQPDDMEKVDD